MNLSSFLFPSSFFQPSAWGTPVFLLLTSRNRVELPSIFIPHALKPASCKPHISWPDSPPLTAPAAALSFLLLWRLLILSMDNSETPCVFSASLHPFPIDCRDLQSTLWPIPYSSHFPKRNVFSSELPNLGVSYIKWINQQLASQKKKNQTSTQTNNKKKNDNKTPNYKSNFWPLECIKTGLCSPCFLLCSFFQVSFR